PSGNTALLCFAVAMCACTGVVLVLAPPGRSSDAASFCTATYWTLLHTELRLASVFSVPVQPSCMNRSHVGNGCLLLTKADWPTPAWARLMLLG
ncbi:MAG: hypothetical protein ACF8AM_10470, partial [Rhodopirellula sp. JB055]|uniref:hypothetical protein n=1 Tax=Rhodopirellula sp. JB055 TaxID=3342846 RepID=UPI00370CB051